MSALDHTYRQPDRDTQSLRQIAILLQSLPERTHRVLLGQLGNEAKQDIADVMLMLGEVDAMEQYRVLKRMRDELEAETSRVEKVESEIQDEIQIGRARVSKKRSPSIYRGPDSISTTTIEHSELSIPSHVASMETEDRQNHFRSTEPLSTADCSSDRSSADESMGLQNDGAPSDRVQSLFARFHQTQAAGVLAMPQTDRSGSQDRSHPLGHGTRGTIDRGTIGRDVLPMRNEVQTLSPTYDQRSERDSDPDRCDHESLAERVDQFLTQLPPQELCRALGMVTTKQAFFVLCGLPNETAETVLSLLPRRQSRKVRSDMRRMGQLQLSDIDSAKRVVAEIAIRLTTRPQSFAA